MGAHQTCQRYPQSTIKFNLSSTQDVEPMESVHLNYQTLTVPSTLCVVPDPSWRISQLASTWENVPSSHQKAQKKILIVPCPCSVPRSSMSRITRFRLCKVSTISKAKAAVVKAQKKAVVKVPKKAKLLKAENLIRVRKTTKPPRVV